jgi:hypothetical protein
VHPSLLYENFFGDEQMLAHFKSYKDLQSERDREEISEVIIAFLYFS